MYLTTPHAPQRPPSSLSPVDLDIRRLNALLRGELAAVETYGQCVAKMNDVSVVRQLLRLRASHLVRVELLRDRINELGGTPETSSGVWGSFAKLMEGGAKILGKSAAAAVIEEGESHGSRAYSDLDDLTDDTRTFVVHHLLPEQDKTHELMVKLQSKIV